MFAYGQRYLNGVGDLFLIYPRTKDFSRTLPVFQFSNDLQLWAVAFDLELGAVVEEGVPENLKGVVGIAPWSDTIH